MSNIFIHNVPADAYYYFHSGEWEVDYDETSRYFTLFAYDNSGKKTSITAPKEVSSTDRSNSVLLGKGPDDYLFFIPQTLTPWDGSSYVRGQSGCYIEIQCKIVKGDKYYAGSAANKDGSVFLPFGDTLQKGYIHRYNIRMGTSLKDENGNKIDFRGTGS